MNTDTNNPERVVVFRTGTDQDEKTIEMLYRELKAGCLRQGWGRAGLSLLDENGDQIDKAQWVENYRSVSKEEPTSRRYSALKAMLELHAGDIVVIPKLPKEHKLSIARVNGYYRFAKDDHIDRDDFRHIIPVDKDSVRTFHKYANEYAHAVYGLFSRANHRYPVTFAYNKDHIDAAIQLLGKESDSHEKSPEDLIQASLDDALEHAANAMLEKTKSWNAQQFESAVKTAFVNQGYQINNKYRRYDGKGADVDIVVCPPGNHNYSLFMPTEIAVQVKWKQGIDSNDIRAVTQLATWNESSLAKKFVISSADSFTDACKEKAFVEDITLIGGLNTMYFLMGVPKFDAE